MPIYEYRCTKGHTFDVMQRFSDDALTTCEICGASAQRVMHAPAVHFKGSGFYNTDYGTRKRSRENEQHKEKSKSEAAGESKSSSDSGSSSASDSGSTSSDSGSKSSDSGAKSSDSGSRSGAKAKTAD